MHPYGSIASSFYNPHAVLNFRIASEKDNPQLLRLCRLTGMDGETGLRIDRNPDFFSLLRLRGESIVFVAEEDNALIGCICVSKQLVYVAGEIHRLHYIGDFKVLPAYRKKGIGLQLCNELANYVVGDGGDLAFLNVSKGNQKPFSFFKDRPGIPDFQPVGEYIIYQLIGKKKTRAFKGPEIEEARSTEEISVFLDSAYRNYQLSPVINLVVDDRYFVIRKAGRIVAAICITDMMTQKQNVVTRLTLTMKLAVNALNAIAGLTGISKMPRLHEPVKMIYVKYLACLPGENEAATRLLEHARTLAYNMGYSFASIGLHEKDPLNACIPGLFKLTFKSVGMLLSIKNSKQVVEKIKHGIPFEDYSLV